MTDFFGSLGQPDPIEHMLSVADDMFVAIDRRWSLADEEVRGLFGAAYPVDEIAIYFPSREALFAFMGKAIQREWMAFNCDEDVVTTHPITSTYAVEYWFLKHFKKPYRLELMVVRDGFSPYHGACREMTERHGLAAVLAHASFKVPNEQEYAAVGVALRNGGFEPAMHCTSTYGTFSYYLGKDATELPAIKPRINTRDAAANDAE